MALDNTCFGYTLIYDEGKKETYEMCAPLRCGECENCKFYKPSYILQHDKALASVRQNKINSGKLKIKYNLRVNGNDEGNFDNIAEIDRWLKKSKYSIVNNIKLGIEDIYDKNAITIKIL